MGLSLHGRIFGQQPHRRWLHRATGSVTARPAISTFSTKIWSSSGGMTSSITAPSRTNSQSMPTAPRASSGRNSTTARTPSSCRRFFSISLPTTRFFPTDDQWSLAYAYAIAHPMDGVPMVFYGQEMGAQDSAAEYAGRTDFRRGHRGSQQFRPLREQFRQIHPQLQTLRRHDQYLVHRHLGKIACAIPMPASTRPASTRPPCVPSGSSSSPTRLSGVATATSLPSPDSRNPVSPATSRTSSLPL